MSHLEFAVLLGELIDTIRSVTISSNNATRDAAAKKRNKTLKRRYYHLFEYARSNAIEQRLRAEAQTTSGARVKFPPHDTHARYVHRKLRCRCDDCRAANAAYIKTYRRVKVRGN